MFCSVVIPLYNKALYIEDAIRSVLDQSHQEFEIIVVDDGSRDDGPGRVLAFGENRIRLVQQANSGVSRARNHGVNLARGNLVCFLDADDWYQSSYLATIASMAEANPEIGFFATAFRRVSVHHASEMNWDCGSPDTFERVDDLYARWRPKGPFFCTNSVAVRRELLMAMQPLFPPGEPMGEDQDLWFRLGEKSPLLFCPLPLVGYRAEVDSSLCATHPVRSLLPVFRRVEMRARGNGMPKRLCPSALRLVLDMKTVVARTALLEGSRSTCLTQLIKPFPGIRTRRWWVTLIMCLVIPLPLVRRWVAWRQQLAKTW